jgi:twitching motility protein PilT
MLKITQAPTIPIKTLQKVFVNGMADAAQVGHSLTLILDDQMKITGPPIQPDGSWQVELSFQEPGKHRIEVLLGTERTEVAIPVVADGVVKPHFLSSKDRSSVEMPETVQLSGDTPTLKQLIQEAYAAGASDIHLGVGKTPRFRILGELKPTQYPASDDATFFGWLREVVKEKDIRQFQTTLELDGSAQYDFTRIRLNVYSTLQGPAMVLRLIPIQVKSIEALGLPEVFKKISHFPKGLVLVTGPTGVGKSTSLAAIIDYINHTAGKHIVTLEDPIEFVFENDKAIVSQREVGLHTMEFLTALKACLRADPDIIVIGELRDRAVVDTAINAAQTGHLVFATLHTNSAVKTVERILNFYNPEEQAPMRSQVSECLVAVIAQGLVKTVDEKRAAFHEILINTDSVKDYIRRGELGEIEALIPRCVVDGMCTMNQSLFDLYKAGRIDKEVGIDASPRPNELMIMMRGGTNL